MQRMLWVLLFAAQIFCSCGKVILLRGESYHINSNVSERKYICLSKDDGGALVVNDDIKQYQQGTLTSKPIIEKSQNTLKYNTWINCKLPELAQNSTKLNKPNCLESWSLENWSLTDSSETFMGPVFDQRWEDFLELKQNFFWYDFSTAGAASISIRSRRDIQIFICLINKSKESYTDDDVWKNCFRILLKYKTKSSIEFCKFVSMQKFPNTSIWDLKSINHNCSSSITTCEKWMSLSATEWRTFVISWDFWKRNISVYGTNNEVLTFE
ncbi:uncharacterized protein LOC109863162, partial [Pseudomyrmex gracilis]